jgi:hypothetical protein
VASSPLGTPEVEVLHRALREVLALRYGLRLGVAFDDQHAHTTLAQLDGQTHADGAAADDQDLSAVCRHRCCCRVHGLVLGPAGEGPVIRR